LIPSRELESQSREFGALPEIPTRRDFVGRRVRWSGAALAGGRGSPCGIRYMNDHRSCQSRNRGNRHPPVTNPRPSPPGRTSASSSMTAQTGLGFALPRNFKKMLNTRDFVALAPNSLLDGTIKLLEQAVVSPKITRQERSNTASRGHPEDAERAL
jgi:hypothetical protein